METKTINKHNETDKGNIPMSQADERYNTPPAAPASGRQGSSGKKRRRNELNNYPGLPECELVDARDLFSRGFRKEPNELVYIRANLFWGVPDELMRALSNKAYTSKQRRNVVVEVQRNDYERASKLRWMAKESLVLLMIDDMDYIFKGVDYPALIERRFGEAKEAYLTAARIDPLRYSA